MAEVFKKIASVRDVFIHDRRGRDGQRFGFVRFNGSINKDRIGKMLNNI